MPDPCDLSSLQAAPGACIASGPFVVSFLSGFAAGLLVSFVAWLFKLPQQAGRRWKAFWRYPPQRYLFGFALKSRPTRGQRLRSWWRELWPLWLRYGWGPLAAVVRRLLLPRG